MLNKKGEYTQNQNSSVSKNGKFYFYWKLFNPISQYPISGRNLEIILETKI